MRSINIQIGKLGEQLAARFLVNKGYKILTKNFYTRYGEIDLVVAQGEEIVFCEVKTRTSSEYGYPEVAVDENKIQNLLRAIQIYIGREKMKKFWRLDIVAIELNIKNKKAQIKWLKNVSMDLGAY